MDKKSLFDIFGNHSSVHDKEKTKTLTWTEFLEKTGSDIDKRLIAHAKKEGLIYIGGKCILTVTESENDKFIMNVDVTLYYKDQFKAENNFQIYPLHTERKFEDFALDDEETKNQLEQIKNEQFKFNVEAPQIKNEKE